MEDDQTRNPLARQLSLLDGLNMSDTDMQMLENWIDNMGELDFKASDDFTNIQMHECEEEGNSRNSSSFAGTGTNDLEQGDHVIHIHQAPQQLQVQPQNQHYVPQLSPCYEATGKLNQQPLSHPQPLPHPQPYGSHDPHWEYGSRTYEYPQRHWSIPRAHHPDTYSPFPEYVTHMQPPFSVDCKPRFEAMPDMHPMHNMRRPYPGIPRSRHHPFPDYPPMARRFSRRRNHALRPTLFGEGEKRANVGQQAPRFVQQRHSYSTDPHYFPPMEFHERVKFEHEEAFLRQNYEYNNAFREEYHSRYPLQGSGEGLGLGQDFLQTPFTPQPLPADEVYNNSNVVSNMYKVPSGASQTTHVKTTPIPQNTEDSVKILSRFEQGDPRRAFLKDLFFRSTSKSPESDRDAGSSPRNGEVVILKGQQKKVVRGTRKRKKEVVAVDEGSVLTSQGESLFLSRLMNQIQDQSVSNEYSKTELQGSCSTTKRRAAKLQQEQEDQQTQNYH